MAMRVVIAGGGFGGVKAALELANKPGVDVTLIAPTVNFEYHGALYRSATGRSPLEVTIPLREIFASAKNVTVVLDRVHTLEPKKNRVISSTNNIYDYDQLILALGNAVNYFGIEGMKENSETMITVPAAIALRHKLVALCRSTIEKPMIAIVGAGATGVELAGDLQNFADAIASKYSLSPKQLRITIIEGANRVLPALKKTASDKASARLAKLGVAMQLNTRVNSCEKGKLCLDIGEINADMIIWTAGSKAVAFFERNAALFSFTKGRVAVDKHLRAEGYGNVYVIGDNAATRYSGMAQTALHDAKFVAHNLLRQIRNEPATEYRARTPIYVVPVGKRWAVLQTSLGIISGYKGWLVRRRADLWIFKNFEPYKRAIKQWRKGNRMARF